MTEEIPQLYKTKTIELNGHELEIKGFRGNDYAITRTINKISNETVGISLRLKNIVKDKKDEELTDGEIDEVIKVRSEIEDVDEKLFPLISKLGQRGIKRAYYPEIKSIEKIDKIPNVELEYDFLKEVYKIMSNISSPPKNIGDDEKKPNTEPSDKN